MMRPFLLAENNWHHLKDFRFDLAVLPWGATEAHNYHLPYGTDVIEADAFAAMAAAMAWEKGGRLVVLPTKKNKLFWGRIFMLPPAYHKQ